MSRIPSLLVSVRDVAEARALSGSGCSIVDVKEPSRGALGRADEQVIADIADALPDDVQFSVALGEVAEWSGMARLPGRLDYVKLGLAGLAGNADWVEAWQRVRQDVRQLVPRAACVAVAYADAESAKAPSLLRVMEAAIRTQCSGLLIDTFTKRSGGGLFQYAAVSELADVCARCRDAGLFFAIAGQLRTTDAERIVAVAPDVVGIRGAACPSLDRGGTIDPAAVADFAAALETGSAVRW